MKSHKNFFALFIVMLNLSSCTVNTKSIQSTQSKSSQSSTKRKRHRPQPASSAPRLSELKYTSASVLPYYFDQQGVKKVILADEAHGWDRTTFADFGGKRDNGETHPVQTAAHELYQEAIIPTTLGWSLDQTLDFIDIAKSGNTQLITVYSRKKTCHVTYFTDFTPYRHTLFHHFPGARRHATQSEFREKNKLAIVEWDTLKNVVSQQRSSYTPKNMPVRISALVQNPRTGKFNTEMITLRPAMVMSLRPFFLNRMYVQGWSKKIRFYNE
ncbi:MAG TPA: NUDIX hydrolase [Candidatus Babeliales bacterium]|nr:NUDIX hydrolase [Candidatus Babeliales bacterium]